MSDDIQQLRDEWEATTLRKTLDRFGERVPEFNTESGIPAERIYTPPDIEAEYGRDLGFPGQYPFTRGVQPTMYRGRFWTMRQYAGFGTAEETNARYKYLLEQGQTGLSVAFDLPTQIGYDADDPLATGEVGKVGTINAPATVLLAMYIAVAKKQGVASEVLQGTVQNDILKEYVARGTYIFPPGPSMRLITDLFRYCHEHVPRWNTISISGYHIREAGSTAVQEVAFTLANAIAYVEAALDAGLEVDDFAPRLSFFFNAHNNLLEEVAKYRAARRLWARIMRDRFQAQNQKSWMLRFHTQTAGSMLTAQQPENNVIRITLQALAAVLGGTQSLHTNSRDEALSLPTEGSVQIALRTQQIMAHESGVADSIDPLAGSYLIESWTDEIEKRAIDYIDRIDALGGARKAIEQGYVQREIQESAYRWQVAVDRGDRTVVGVNHFRIEEDLHLDLLRVDPSVGARQMTKLRALRQRRDNETFSVALDNLEVGARNDDKMMPLILTAVEQYATLGEICGVLRTVFGEHEAFSLL
jgi:methylmalonyl-CoA mutase N-terminal domain/subunit